MSENKEEKFPDPAPTFDITVKATLQADFDKYSSGSVCMTMYPCQVTTGETEIGTVAFAIPSGVSVTIGKRHYFVDFLDMFKAIHAAEKRLKCRHCGKEITSESPDDDSCADCISLGHAAAGECIICGGIIG